MAGPGERHKMLAGEWYTCRDAELEQMQQAARNAVHQHNSVPPDARGAMAPALGALLASVGRECFIEAPFHCAYGINISLGDAVYMNAGCVVLDTAPVQIGSGTLLGPMVQIYCARHATDPDRRAAGLEVALPVRIGANVWIGGGAIVMPGVSIGENAIVGAGSVVLRDVPAGATVVGNPARPVRKR